MHNLGAKTLNKGMRQIREENKVLQSKCQQVSDAYEDLVLKEPNHKEHYLLKTLLKTIHEKCVKAEEAYKQAMDLYLKESLAKRPTPSLGSNDIELMKEEI